MQKPINATMKVYDVVTNYPESVNIFLAHGFSLITNPVKLKTVARFVTLETACTMKHVNVELFVRELNSAVETTQTATDCCQFQIDETRGDINIAALLPCPVTIPIKEVFTAYTADFKQRTGLNVALHVKAAALDFDSNNPTPYSDHDLFIAPGFDHFSGQHSHYRQRTLPPLNDTFAQAQMADPHNRYLITGAAPAVFIRNKKRGEDHDLSWKNLCNEKFSATIATPLAALELQKGIAHQLYSDFGEHGVQTFIERIQSEHHPAEMVKQINRNKLNHIDLFIVPWFFTTMLNHDDFEVVWPSDGAIALPLILSIRDDSLPQTDEIAQYLYSDVLANVLSADGLYPSSHRSVKQTLPDHATFRWIGWEHLYQPNFQQRYQQSVDYYQQQLTAFQARNNHTSATQH